MGIDWAEVERWCEEGVITWLVGVDNEEDATVKNRLTHVWVTDNSVQLRGESCYQISVGGFEGPFIPGDVVEVGFELDETCRKILNVTNRRVTGVPPVDEDKLLEQIIGKARYNCIEEYEAIPPITLPVQYCE